MRLAPVPMRYAGAEAIPTSWRAKLAMAGDITSLADRLYDRST